MNVPKQVPLEEGFFTIPDEPGEGPRLIGSYSPQADKYFYPRRRRCPITAGPVEDVLLSTEGVLYSWTVVVDPWFGGSAKFGSADVAGQGVGMVDLPEGVRIQAPISGVAGQHEWEIGTRMVLELHPVALNSEGDELCAFRFAPIGTGG